MDSRLEFAYSVYQELEPGIGRNCSIGKDVVIGAGTQICDNVVIEDGVTIGKNCLIHHGAVIGQKGFGFATETDGTPIRITHTGGVIIGDDVEVGALSCVPAGTVEPTIIKDHVKIDTHVHIGHNNFIGEKTLIAAGAIIGGSVTIGKMCFIGLNCTIKQKITIADNTLAGAQANVVKDILEPGNTVIGNPAKRM
jgi:UDP-3-O-[3-hydroxymyristoyl] glucosamine N-acyltransferase LpxD